MANTNVAMYPAALQNGKVQILPADTTTNKTVVTAGAQGTKVSSLIITSTDTSARDVLIGIANGGTTFPLGMISIPITAGNTNAIPAVNGFAVQSGGGGIQGLAVDSNGNPYLDLVSGDTLIVAAQSTVTTAKAISVIANSGGVF